MFFSILSFLFCFFFRKVLIPITPQDVLPHYEIKRRPTGFITPEDLAAFIKSRHIDGDDDDDEDEDDEDGDDDNKPDRPEEMLESDKKVTAGLIKDPVTIKSEKIETAKKDTMFKEGTVKKKGAMFVGGEDDDYDLRYRLKNIA